MAQWQPADAKQRSSKLVEAASSHDPKVVMRHKEPGAVVISPAEYRRLVRQADANFGRRRLQSPFAPEEPVGMNPSSGA